MKITSRKNEIIVRLKKLGADSAFRRETGLFYCDGEKLLIEAVKNGAELDTVLYCGELNVKLPEGMAVFETEKSVIDSVSPMKTPQNVVFSCKKRPPARITSGGRYIVLEDVQDPGNVGTVLRTAGAFGVDAVLLTGACADPYNNKAVRASMGAVFRVPFIETDLEGLKTILDDNSIKLIGAALSEDSRDIRTVDFHNTAVAIGSEGHGLSREILSLCEETAIIPMDPKCESLNAAAAAAIIMWEMAR